MRFTIERLRTLVLAAGVLLIAALVVFLAIGKWKNPLNRHDLPKRLGADIQQEANGFTYTQAHGGHTLFKIQASKVVQLKQGYAMLHDVHIEIFDTHGNRMDSIQGNEFEYNQQAGTAKANGPVEITLTRAVAASANAPGSAAAAQQVSVRTSGLVFDQNSGLASTNEQVEFELEKGSGSADGATLDSEQGLLVLDRSVKMSLRRGADVAELQAAHAEFERSGQTCRLMNSTVRYRGSQLDSGASTLHFRNDGSVAQLDAQNQLTLTSASGSRVTAPTGTVNFDSDSHPRHGFLQGGVALESVAPDRQIRASAPTAKLEFTPSGVLATAHLERGVQMTSDSEQTSAKGPERSHTTWASSTADLRFRDTGQGRIEIARLDGDGGVIIRGQSQHGTAPPTPYSLAADAVSGIFSAGSVLTDMTGTGHARMEQTTAKGAQDTTQGDTLVAHFASSKSGATRVAAPEGNLALDSATVEGHVVLTETPAAQAGNQVPAAMRATGGKAVYRSESGKIWLTESPRVEEGDLQVLAQSIEVTQSTGDAEARGGVKATWLDHGDSGDSGPRSTAGLGMRSGQGPVHAVAEQAALNQSTSEVKFTGHARFWQASNSISAPVIILNRTKQLLTAHASGSSDPVQVVMVGALGTASGGQPHSANPSVIRMQGGALTYSAAERKAVMRSDGLGKVQVETADMESTSSEVDVYLLPPSNHAGKNGTAAQVDKLIAIGQVNLMSQGRTGTGTRLEYSNDSSAYVLTGTPAQPPMLSDSVRGSVTGEALIFNSRDDSVKVEHAKGQTMTETTIPGRLSGHAKAAEK